MHYSISVGRIIVEKVHCILQFICLSESVYRHSILKNTFCELLLALLNDINRQLLEVHFSGAKPIHLS